MIAKVRRKRPCVRCSTRFLPCAAASTITALKKFKIAAAQAGSHKKGHTRWGAALKPKGFDLPNQFKTGKEIGDFLCGGFWRV